MSLRSTQTQTLKWWVWYLQRCHLFHLPFLAAPIWDCHSRLYLPHFLVPSSPSALSTKLATKQQFLRKCMSTKILFCWHHNVLFWKRKDTFKKQNIDKIRLQKSFKKAWLFAKSALSRECSGMLDAQPATVYPASPDDPSRNLKLIWSEHHCIYFLTIVLSTIVAVGMKFDPTCRQRNLSSMTALHFALSSTSSSATSILQCPPLV